METITKLCEAVCEKKFKVFHHVVDSLREEEFRQFCQVNKKDIRLTGVQCLCKKDTPEEHYHFISRCSLKNDTLKKRIQRSCQFEKFQVKSFEQQNLSHGVNLILYLTKKKGCSKKMHNHEEMSHPLSKFEEHGLIGSLMHRYPEYREARKLANQEYSDRMNGRRSNAETLSFYKCLTMYSNVNKC